MYRSWLPLGFGNRFWPERRDHFADDLQNRFAVLIAQLVVRGKALTNLSRDVRCRLSQSLLGIPHLADRHTVQQATGERHEDDDLFRDGRRFELRLFEDGSDSLAMVDNLAGVFVKTGAELGEGFQLRELRVRELEIARHGPVGRRLCLATDA